MNKIIVKIQPAKDRKYNYEYIFTGKNKTIKTANIKVYWRLMRAIKNLTIKT